MEENKEERFVRNMRLLYAAWCVLEENGMTSGSEIVRNGRGASKDFPIVIRATEDYYVRLEYLILSLLLRDKEYEVVFQGLIEADGRMLDYLRVSVKESPEAETAVEGFFFDITAGYEASTKENAIFVGRAAENSKTK